MPQSRSVRSSKFVCPSVRHDATLLYEVWSDGSLVSTSDDGDLCPPCPGLSSGNSGPKLIWFRALGAEDCPSKLFKATDQQGIQSISVVCAGEDGLVGGVSERDEQYI